MPAALASPATLNAHLVESEEIYWQEGYAASVVVAVGTLETGLHRAGSEADVAAVVGGRGEGEVAAPSNASLISTARNQQGDANDSTAFAQQISKY